MAASERTKKCRAMTVIMSILHFLCLFGPLLGYLGYAFAIGTEVTKVSLGIVAVAAVILIVAALLFDQVHRQGLYKTAFWSVIGILILFLKYATPFVLTLSIVSIIDELVIVRVRDHYKAALLANKEIDKRS